MRKNIKNTLSLALVLILSLSAISTRITAYATESIDERYMPITTEMANCFREMAEIASKCTDITDPQEIEKYTDLSSSLLKDDSISVNAGKSNLDFDTVHVIKGKFENNAYTFFNIAINGDYSKLSNLNIIFDATDNLVYYSETLLENNVETNKFIVSNYQNGVLIEQKQTDVDYISNEQISSGIKRLKTFAYEEETRGWGEKVGCLAAVVGVSGIVAKLIAATCVAACTAEPVGVAVCAACISGVCVLGGADIAGIVECFKL